MIEITVTLSFSNTYTIYIKKSKFSKKLKNDFFLPNFKNFKNFILCNKTITTLELDTHYVCTTVCIMSSQLEKPYHYETRSSDTAFPTDST